MAKQRVKGKKDGQKAKVLEEMPPLNRNAAGIDVGGASHRCRSRMVQMKRSPGLTVELFA